MSVAACHDERFIEYIALFNERAFWECHEVLEDLWLDTYDGDRHFYQGLIHFAAAFHHLWRGNRSGCRKLMTTTLSHLDGFPAEHLGLDLGVVRGAAQAWLGRLDDGQAVYDDTQVPRLSLRR